MMKLVYLLLLLEYAKRLKGAKDGLPMGSDYNLSVELISPNGTEKTTSGQIVGNLSVIGIVAQRHWTRINTDEHGYSKPGYAEGYF